MTKENDDEGHRFFTFEWVCHDPSCGGEGQIHRKRIRAANIDKARVLAQTQGIPGDAKIIEEAEDKLKMRILW